MNELREDLIYCSVKNGGWFFSTSWVSISLSVLSPSVLASETWPCWLSPHWLLAQHGCYYGPNTNQVDPRSCFHAMITIEHRISCPGYRNGPSVLQQHEHPGLRMPKRHPLRTPKQHSILYSIIIILKYYFTGRENDRGYYGILNIIII